mmetsp:Transcript_16973/g.19145  ORF Transcript_16973/g.19145 Transcript_16973/m.19145 type:complete len:97 (+) Transcript_16973:50-340(+)
MIWQYYLIEKQRPITGPTQRTTQRTTQRPTGRPTMRPTSALPTNQPARPEGIFFVIVIGNIGVAAVTANAAAVVAVAVDNSDDPVIVIVFEYILFR